MRRSVLHVVAGCVIAMLGTTWAEDEKGAISLRLQLDLVDGSRIVGTPGIATVPVQTSYANMDIPLRHILTITMAADHETGSLVLQNGDSLTGVIDLEPIEIDTVFGSVKIAIEHVRSLRVVLAGGTWPRDGLWGYWPLNGDARDASGNGHDGVIKGAQPADGVSGQAYSFDGNSAIEVGNPDLSGEEFAIAGWIRTTRPASAEDWRSWIDKLDNSGGPFEMFLGDGRDEGSGNSPCFLAWNRRHESVAQMVASRLNMRDGSWHHCAATYKKGSQKFYVDGKLVGENSYSGPLPANSEPISIGGHNFQAYHHPWIGDVDEVFIYLRALSPDEVQALYRCARR